MIKLAVLFATFIVLASGLVCSSEEEKIAKIPPEGVPVMVDYVQEENALKILFEVFNFTDPEPHLPFFMNLKLFGACGLGYCGKNKLFICGNISDNTISLSGCRIIEKKRFSLLILSAEMSSIVHLKNHSLGFKLCEHLSIREDITKSLRECGDVSVDVKACIDYRKGLKLFVLVTGIFICLLIFGVFAVAYNLLQDNEFICETKNLFHAFSLRKLNKLCCPTKNLHNYNPESVVVGPPRSRQAWIN